VPLSEEEARLLHQLEQSLAAEDPDFASTLRGSKFLAHNRRVAILAVLGFLAGIALLFGGAVSAMTWLGVFGFVVMLGGAYIFVTAWRRGIGQREESNDEEAPQKPSGSFVDRLEERWQRRQDGDDL
jgi:threonine/homoserine/homoserine lactone efflux protein